MVHFSVKAKGSRDKARLGKLLELQGPDPETLELLQRGAPGWLKDPEEFWRRPPTFESAYLDPQTEVVGYILQTSQGDA